VPGFSAYSAQPGEPHRTVALSWAVYPLTCQYLSTMPKPHTQCFLPILTLLSRNACAPRKDKASKPSAEQPALQDVAGRSGRSCASSMHVGRSCLRIPIQEDQAKQRDGWNATCLAHGEPSLSKLCSRQIRGYPPPFSNPTIPNQLQASRKSGKRGNRTGRTWIGWAGT
jgi:hypothetical protein